MFGQALSTSDLLGLIGLLLGVIFAFSWLFQRIGEARLAHLVDLRHEVDASVRSLEGAVKTLGDSQTLAVSTIERIVRSLDVVAAYLEANGGVMQDLLEAMPQAGNPDFAEAHAIVVNALRQANDELRVLSTDPERRLSAVKNLAYGDATFRALECVEMSATLYPDDTALRDITRQLRQHLRSGR